MRYLHSELHELDGYNQSSGYSLKCVLELVASTSHAKVPSKAPQWTGLSQTSSKIYIFSRIIHVHESRLLKF